MASRHPPAPLLRGSIPALISPFRPGDGALDEPALCRLAERAALRGAGAVVVCGSTGEAAAMTPAEQAHALRAVVEAVGGRLPVVAGIGASGTDAAVALAVAAERCGAAALLCAAPAYVRPSQAGIAAHLRAVAAAAGLPVVLYDVPARTGVAIADDTVARLFESGTVQALKDATADLSRPARLRRLCGEGLTQLSGDDATALAHLAMGGSGCVSVSANVAPGLCAALHSAWAAAEMDRVRELRDWLAPLHAALFLDSNPVPVKAALGLLGLCNGTPRLPLLRAGREVTRVLSDILSELSPLEESLARRASHPWGLRAGLPA